MEPLIEDRFIPECSEFGGISTACEIQWFPQTPDPQNVIAVTGEMQCVVSCDGEMLVCPTCLLHACSFSVQMCVP